MRDLLVFDPGRRPYDDETILHQPLGGTESAVLETCMALAADLDLALFNGVPGERLAGRLLLKPFGRVAIAEFLDADWVVFVNAVPLEVLERLPFRAGRPRLALWVHHDIDQRAVQWLEQPSLLRQVSRFIFVSEWQRSRYCDRFAIDRSRTEVIGNPYCPRACEQAAETAKQYERPHFIYTSTPFRGLDILADAFPLAARRLPGATLTVLSGMELYGSNDNARFQPLFDRMAGMPQVQCLKPCGKLDLYARLRAANVFSYPSTFPETFCISALEARVMEDALLLTGTGALPELFPDAGFVPWTTGAPSAEEWADAMVRAWHDVSARAPTGELAAAAAGYRRMFSPTAVAARLRRALFD